MPATTRQQTSAAENGKTGPVGTPVVTSVHALHPEHPVHHPSPLARIMLCHPKKPTSYEFHPRGENVIVEFTSSMDYFVYTVPLQEARDLWRHLEKQGYTRF